MAGYLKITCHVEHGVLWCEAGHVTDACPCGEPEHEGLRCGPLEHGPLSVGLPVMEGDREIGTTGEWMMLVPRIYTLCVNLADGKRSAVYEIEMRDYEQIEQTIVLT